jgi:hypothetical protein
MLLEATFLSWMLWLLLGMATFNIGPCDCCGGGGPGAPYANCSACLADIIGIRITVSGYEDRQCCVEGGSGDSLFECFAVNGSYVLTDLIGSGSSHKVFALDIAADDACGGGGILIDRQTRKELGFANCSGEAVVCVSERWIRRLECTVRCDGFGMEFGPVTSTLNACIPAGCGPGAGASIGDAGGSKNFALVCDDGESVVVNKNVDYCRSATGQTCQALPAVAVAYEYEAIF